MSLVIVLTLDSSDGKPFKALLNSLNSYTPGVDQKTIFSASIHFLSINSSISW